MCERESVCERERERECVWGGKRGGGGGGGAHRMSDTHIMRIGM